MLSFSWTDSGREAQLNVLFDCSIAARSVSAGTTCTTTDSCQSTRPCTRCPILRTAVTNDATPTTTTCGVILSPPATAAGILRLSVTVARRGSSVLSPGATTSPTVHYSVTDASDDRRAKSVDGSAQRHGVLQRRDTAARTASRRHLLRTRRTTTANECCSACQKTKFSHSYRQSTGAFLDSFLQGEQNKPGHAKAIFWSLF